MFIQTEDTPNPNTTKFLLPTVLMPNDSVSLTRGSESLQAFPVAIALFDIEDVQSVFICNNFISVTKESEADWAALKTTILSKILELTSQNAELVNQSILAQNTAQVNNNDKSAGNVNELEGSIITQIKELIETRVRPAVAQDGGDIVYHDFRDGIVYLELHGACSGCPSSTVTLKSGIENMLKHYIPEVEAVEAV